MALVAALQLETQGDPAQALERIRHLATKARSRGAEVIALPENALDERVDAPPLDAAPLAALARELGAAIVAGTVREAAEPRPYQTCFVFDASGREVHRYRKVHLFDVDVPGGPSERESAAMRPGPADGVRPFELPPLGTCGVGICYDLRFPELWRRLALAGARTLFAPSSFALGTGKDHWHVLLRARAIEDLAWVVAPAQVGAKPGGRQRYGHALIVDPWGSVVADAGAEGEGFAMAEVDPGLQERIRTRLPALRHVRL